MLQEEKSSKKLVAFGNKDPKSDLQIRLDKQLRLLQNTLVKLEDVEMQRLFNGLVASMLTHPQSNEPGVAKEIKIEEVKAIECDSDLTQSQKKMIYEVGEKLAYLKDLMGDKE